MRFRKATDLKSSILNTRLLLLLLYENQERTMEVCLGYFYSENVGCCGSENERQETQWGQKGSFDTCSSASHWCAPSFVIF